MDVVALAQHGIDYAVATLGTATTPVHVAEALPPDRHRRVLLRRRRRGAQGGVARAGKHAAGARRRQERAVPVPARTARIPTTIVRKRGKAAFEALFERATPLSEFLLRELSIAAPAHLGRGPRARSSTPRGPISLRLTAPVACGAPAAAAGRAHRAAGNRAARPAARLTSARRPAAGAAGERSSRPAGPRGPGQRQAPSLVRELIQGLLLQPELARSEIVPEPGRRHRRGCGSCRVGAVLRRR